MTAGHGRAGRDLDGGSDRRPAQPEPTTEVRCAPGVGVSVEAGLLKTALTEGRPLDPAMLDRLTFAECVPPRPLGEVRP